ncbi:2'-5' RNA ligase [Thermolongibacillus altinsuensis]|jgi:2'-5' RNA ligase|uniref:Putative phosphoesterase EDD69_10413 n=1 Tax=Thermolongibacillus altinsuensis TaxID=575256 RepID=A0A4R1QEY4_9BACL|nr:YjcG family protein [Thermolongibacillus altinsuensis]TCL50964.1 2'-5' RNA ligase [Thermolongibacillus altinsuensis]GMB08967.1 putative phosphoesterase YjcG [Thermolongibacillus altinsuensis]
MKCGIAIFPSKKIQDFANSYRKRYDTHYSLIPPHLTLKNTFEVEEDQIESVVKELHKIAAEIEPFPLRITKFSSFYPASNIIYLKVEPNESLTTLYNKLHSGPFQEQTEDAFVPHITIGRDLSNDEFSDVYGQLKMQKVHFEETVDRFHLLYQLENGSWTAYETFHLGKEQG